RARLKGGRNVTGRHAGIRPVLLVDRGARENAPAPPPAFQPVEETCPRRHVDGDPVDRLPHQDHDAGFGDGVVAGDAYEWRRDQMLRETAALAMLDELAERTAEPRHGDLAVRVKRIKELAPAALIAVEAPCL